MDEEKEPLNPALQLTPVDVMSASLVTDDTTTVELSASLMVVVPVLLVLLSELVNVNNVD